MKEKRRPILAVFALLFSVALVAAACGDDAEETAAGSGEMSDEEMAMGDGEHDHGPAIEVPEGMAVPRISVAAEPDTVSGHNLFIELDDFTITPENASTDPVDGEGHLHLYVDGQRVSRFYNTALQLTGLDAGEHEIMVEVSANDHSAYAVDGEPIRAMTAITVESSEGDGHSHGNSELFESETPPTIDISISEDPKSGWNLFADVGDFTFSAENVGGAAVDGEGHLHLSIDGARVTRLYGPWWHISGLEAGDHEITVEVSANDHSAYGAGGEPVIASTTLTVTEAQAMLAGAGHGDDHGDDDHSTAMDGDDHGHGGTGETLDIAAADADVAVGASLSGGDLTVENRRVTIETGQTVSITVESDVDEQVHLHGYDILSDVGPGSPAQFSFLADSAGTFEVELEESGRFLFEIQVR